jgi:hypothetical protein
LAEKDAVTVVLPEVPRVTENDRDEVLDAIDELVGILTASARRIEEMTQQVEAIRDRRSAGQSYREIEGARSQPIITELTNHSLTAVSEAASRLRRAEARALYDEGMTMEQIAALFGVTRQRVSALLKRRRGDARSFDV